MIHNNEDYASLGGINYSTLKKLDKHPSNLLKIVSENDIEPIHFTKGKYFEDLLQYNPKDIKEKYLILDDDINMPSESMQKILNEIAFTFSKPLEEISANEIMKICIKNEYGASNWKEETFANKINLHTKFYNTLIDPRIKITNKNSEDAKIMSQNFLEKFPECFSYDKDEEIVIIDQLVLTAEINGITYKGCLDKVIINHNTRIIYPKDLKTTSKFLPTTPESVAYFILDFRYDIQSSLYTKLLQRNFPDYTIAPFEFLVGSFITPDLSPVRIQMTHEALTNAYDGFEYNGRKYKGWKKLSNDLLWHYETQEFNYWRDAYEANLTFTF